MKVIFTGGPEPVEINIPDDIWVSLLKEAENARSNPQSPYYGLPLNETIVKAFVGGMGVLKVINQAYNRQRVIDGAIRNVSDKK